MDPPHGKSGFTLIELLVVIAIISLLMAVSLPVFHRVRKQARTVSCQSNLRQFGLVMDAYAADHRGCFDLTRGSQKSIYGPLLKYAHNANDLLLCPSASKPALQAHTTVGWLGTTFRAWASLDAAGTVDWQGSYCFNRFAGTLQDFFARGVTPAAFWQNLFWRAFPERPARIPVLLDGRVHAVYPGEFAERSAKGDDTPPYARDVMDAYPDDPWYGIWPFVMDRHVGHTNGLFRDWSVRKVGIKELWTLKWHRRFDTAGPWTTTGGVRPGDWPDWMRKFQDY